jgi:PTS system nitrogen regulatory IIA component
MLALPHIRVSDILHPFVLIGVCENEITDYQGQDDLPVRVIVFTVAPDEDQEAYLQLLSGISRRFRDSSLITELIDNVDNTVRILELVTAEA